MADRYAGAADAGSPKSRLYLSGLQSGDCFSHRAILSGLRVSGYAAPAQIEIVVRIAEGDPAQIAPLVREDIAKTVNVIIANGPPVLHAARSATRTIPIVAIDLETDPVASARARVQERGNNRRPRD